jgi:hypothetical protein
MAFLSIVYNDVDQSTYECIVVEVGKKKIKFDTGDPIVDWLDYCMWRKDQDISVISTSSVDHWHMDGDEYVELLFDSQYNPITRKRLDKLSMGDMMHLPYFIAEKGMKNKTDLEKHYAKKTGREIKIGPEKVPGDEDIIKEKIESKE